MHTALGAQPLTVAHQQPAALGICCPLTCALCPAAAADVHDVDTKSLRRLVEDMRRRGWRMQARLVTVHGCRPACGAAWRALCLALQ